jgi:hypothetical protein
MDRLEALQVELADGLTIAALCLNLPVAFGPDDANPKLCRPLHGLGQRLGPALGNIRRKVVVRDNGQGLWLRPAQPFVGRERQLARLALVRDGRTCSPSVPRASTTADTAPTSASAPATTKAVSKLPVAATT